MNNETLRAMHTAQVDLPAASHQLPFLARIA